MTLRELTLDGPMGQVRTLAVASGMILAGTQVSALPCLL
jgi:hypothetical protein